MKNKVRLPEKSIDAIVKSFRECFLDSDHLWIFGSRVDLQARGGDIDLYVETNETDAGIAIERKSKMVSRIWRSIGEQKIDIVLNVLCLNADLPIYHVAKTNGVLLV